MNQQPTGSTETIPPSRQILDLDQPLQLQALLECLDLLLHPPEILEKAGLPRAWRCQVWVRLSYLLTHCSVSASGSSRGELLKLAQSHNSLAQSLLAQEAVRSRFSASRLD